MSATSYLDYQATTPIEPDVLAEMMDCYKATYANPSGRHGAALRAESRLESARRRIAGVLEVPPRSMVFTSGATEANNLAIKGIARARGSGHLLTAETEHKSVLRCFERLAGEGYECTVLGVRHDGAIDLDQLRQSIRPDTIMASFMLVNNEIGTVHPIGAIAQILHQRNVLLHCDATQGLPNLRVRPRELGIDLLSLSGHKIYGPKGVGLFYLNHDAVSFQSFCPEMDGGGQEYGTRSGTLNVPAACGLARAFELLDANLEQDVRENRLKRSGFLAALPPGLAARVNGSTTDFAPANLSLTLPGIDASRVMSELDHLQISAGAACSSSARGPSHVLKAIGLSDAEAQCTIRVGFGRFTWLEEVELAAQSFATLLMPCAAKIVG